MLVDTQLNTRTDLATLPTAGYAFSVTGAQAAVFVTGRSFLNLSVAAPLATVAGWATTTVQLFSNPAHACATTLTGAQLVRWSRYLTRWAALCSRPRPMRPARPR